MKLLHINASYKPAFIYGGPTMSVAKLCEQLVNAGVELEVFTTTANGATELSVTANIPATIDGVKVIYFKRLTKDHSHFSPALLTALWKRVKQFDVVHIHAWWNLVSVLACLVAVFRGVKVIITPRGTLSAYSFGHKNSLAKKVLHKLLGKPLLNKSFIHTTSISELASLRGLVHPQHFFDIPNFVQLPAEETFKHLRNDTVIKLLFLSRIDEKKGLDILLNALVHVTQPYNLSIVGDGTEAYIDHLKTIAEQNNLSQHISWLGFQHTNKFDLFKQHDLFILPSHDENFGNVVIESLSVGTAVAISDKVGLAAYVTERGLGWVFNLDVLSLADAINQAALAGEQLTAIGQQAPQQIRADFNENKLTQQYIAMYNEILKHG